MSPDEVRAWFDELTRSHMSEPLLGRYRIELVDHDAWLASFDAAKGEVFPGDANMDITRAWSEAQRQRFDELNSVFGVPLQHNIVLHDLEQDDAVMGWAYGVQDQRATWYMAITAIHPDWRGKGIYSAFLRRQLECLREAGFREVLSRHHADNNRVLIAKLRAGFFITTFELTPNYGLMVHLRYNFSDDMRQIYSWRVDGRVGASALRRKGILGPN